MECNFLGHVNCLKTACHISLSLNFLKTNFKKPELHNFHRIDLLKEYIQHYEILIYLEISFLLGQQWAINVVLILKVTII